MDDWFFNISKTIFNYQHMLCDFLFILCSDRHTVESKTSIETFYEFHFILQG